MPVSKKIKILFTSAVPITDFVKTDLELLQRNFDVRAFHWKGEKNALRMVKGILWADLTFSWFADTPAFLVVLFSKMLGKKSIVVASGYSVVNMPEIRYGLMRSPISASKVKFILKNSDKVLAVSEFNKKEILKYTNSRNVELIYHGVDYNRFRPKGEKENIAITVGSINKINIKRKGIETFVKAARYLPDRKFVVIGGYKHESLQYLKSFATPNVEFTGFLSDDELLKYYQKAKVYVQVSAHEAFGLSLAEAMLCECVPVVTDRAAIPEVVGDTGFYVPYDDPKATAKAVKKALRSDKGKEARRRIKNKFPLEKREEELVRIIRKITKETDYAFCV